MIKKELLHFTLYAIIIYLTCGALNPAIAASQPAGGHGTHFCGVIDGQWDKQHSDQFPNRNYARNFAANLNVGEPRTVRLIYFLPNDRPYRTEVVQKMKDEILDIQTFYAEQMGVHGYGEVSFRIETDLRGEPMVHRVDGVHPDSHYLDNTADTVPAEIEKKFDIAQNIYLVVVDNSIIRTLDVGHRIAAVYEDQSKAVYWDGKNGLGEPVASGIYFYTLTAGGYSATRRMVILK